MKLNVDCLRDLLLFLESNLDFNYSIRSYQIKLGNYTENEILYSLVKLDEIGYISGMVIKSSSAIIDYNVKDITIFGHEFLANIKSDTVWSETKKKAKQVGSFSIQILQQIAVNVLSNLITNSINP